MEKIKITGIILSLRPHKEFDRLVMLFSSERGMTPILAKGIRRPRSRRSYGLDLLNEVEMEVEENVGQSRLPYLREVTTKNAFPDCKKKSEAFAAACTAASFLLRTLPHHSSQPEIYTLTKNLLLALEKMPEQPAGLLLPYFLKIIRLLGYLPDRLPKNALKETLIKRMADLDPEFMPRARRVLGMFSLLRNGSAPYSEAPDTPSGAPKLLGRALHSQ